MRTVRWVAGMLRRRPSEIMVAALSIAVSVAFIASLGAFVTQSHAALAVRAAASVPVDWQVQVTPQGDPASVLAAIHQVRDVRAVEPVSYARVPSLVSTGSQGIRQTGAAYVVGVDPSYATTFPGEIRHLVGVMTGPLLFQQTAANLAAGPGSRVLVGHRAVTVAGVVDLPASDSFFQVVGTAPGAGATAPPDNVLIVSTATFNSLVGTASVVHQFHVAFSHADLPADPQAAAVSVLDRANHFQVAVVGGALVGDNLATALTAAGEDAAYANLLFILLGFPGLALAVVVAALVVGLRSDRRRREIALLRLRGAATSAIGRMVAAEAIVTALIGVLIGVPAAWVAIRWALPAGARLTFGWTFSAVIAGFALAAATQVGPVISLALGRTRTSVASEASRQVVNGSPWPLRMGLDVVLLAAAGVSFALTASNGYRVVLAPEGIPQTQVNYAALAGPALAWPGLTLLVWRLTALAAGRRTRRWPVARTTGAPELEAAVLRQRRRVIARGAAGLAAAVGLAVSTAVFTSTYDAQSRVDVALTVGSDVSVTEPSGSAVNATAGAGFLRLPGARGVEPLQHRFAYVGPDLQDIFGVNAATFDRVAPLQDAFVPGSTVSATLTKLRSTPDGVLLSGETLHDYQLHPGDRIRLRLQTGPDHAYRPIDFHVIGQVAEWPTAPKDSFIVANADYLSRTTGSAAISTFLISSSTPAATADAARTALTAIGSTAVVQDISSAGARVTSATGLAATDLSGLSRLELGFGVVLALACSGLALLGGIIARRRALVLLAALGATPRQRSRFIAIEARALIGAGIAGGLLIGTVVAYLLVKVLTGIFDPAPAAATVPWSFVAGTVFLIVVVTSAIVHVAGRLVTRAGPAELRDL